jgi:DHA1 family tetracycline resistance protein-like MFS transporter
VNKNLERRRKLAYTALVWAFFVNFLGYAFIVPILPSWQVQFGFNATQATLLVSLWAVPMFLFGPLTGRLTDKIGAGRTVFFSMVFLSGSGALYLIATEEMVPQAFAVLAAARLIHGASGAAIMTAGLASASQLWPTNFGEQAGKLLAIATIGGLLGPVVGGVTFEYFDSGSFIFLAVATAAVVPLVWYASPAIGKSQTPTQGNVSIKVFVTNPVLLRVGILLMITTIATGALEAGVPLFLSDELQLGSAMIGGVLLVMVLMQGIGSLVWGKLVDKRGPTRYMVIGWSLVVVSLAGVGLFGWKLEGVAAIASMILLLGIFQYSIAAAQIPMLPMIDTAATQACGEGNPGLAFGAFGTAWAAGTILGPLLVGPVYDFSNSWPLALGLLAVPATFALIMTLRNKEMLHECYASVMEERVSEIE